MLPPFEDISGLENSYDEENRVLINEYRDSLRFGSLPRASVASDVSSSEPVPAVRRKPGRPKESKNKKYYR